VCRLIPPPPPLPSIKEEKNLITCSRNVPHNHHHNHQKEEEEKERKKRRRKSETKKEALYAWRAAVHTSPGERPPQKIPADRRCMYRCASHIGGPSGQPLEEVMHASS